MRKRLLFVAIMLLGSIAWAQVPVRDSVPEADDEEENVIGGRVLRPNATGEANILGAPIYYDRDGNKRGEKRPLGGGYHRPAHHYLNSLDNVFCSYFLELETMFGLDDGAIGLNFTYLPKRWGAYGSILFGFNHDYLSVGPVVRLSDYDNTYDWQLYAGLMLGQHLGGELGFRWATPRKSSRFNWISGSMGLAVVDGTSYMTAGLSIELAAITSLTSGILFFLP